MGQHSDAKPWDSTHNVLRRRRLSSTMMHHDLRRRRLGAVTESGTGSTAMTGDIKHDVKAKPSAQEGEDNVTGNPDREPRDQRRVDRVQRRAERLRPFAERGKEASG